jgi:hypothetical protein
MICQPKRVSEVIKLMNTVLLWLDCIGRIGAYSTPAGQVQPQQAEFVARDLGDRDLQNGGLGRIVVNKEIISARPKLAASPSMIFQFSATVKRRQTYSVLSSLMYNGQLDVAMKE